MLQALTAPVLLFALTATPDSDLAAQAEEVRCAETAFSMSVETGDWEAFEAIVHPDARFASGSRPARVGAPAIRAGWERSYSRPERSIRWRSRSVEILKPGALALSRGPYRMRIEDDNGEVSETWGTFNSIWVRESDGWQVIFDQGSEGTEEGDQELIASGGKECGPPSLPAQPSGALEARPFFYALSVQDVERSQAWYERVFGFELVRSLDLDRPVARVRLLQRSGAFLELVELAEAKGPAELDPPLQKRQHLHGVFKFGFEVDDLDRSLARLEALGVELRGRVITETDGSMRSAQVLDPDGNILQIFDLLD